MVRNGLNFFTVCNFSRSGGGSLRIIGIMNSVVKNLGLDLTLYSNEGFNSDGKILNQLLGLEFSSFEKRLFQLSLSVLPVFLVSLLFRKKYLALKLISEEYNLKGKELIFFEYLDLSIGYFMKKNKFISGYVCDIHGLVPNEFKQKKKNRTYNLMRYFSALQLDKKVFANSDGFIFASESMRDYFNLRYPGVENKKYSMLPYLISENAIENRIDSALLSRLRLEYGICSDDKVVFFAGSFKYLGGVVDLVSAFVGVKSKLDSVKLLLIGDGEEFNDVKAVINRNSLQDSIVHIKSIPYGLLRTYQELATVIVCPDKENLYSNMILHLKYYDSLLSGKIVINGSFEAVKEVNVHEILSIDFEPSNVLDLTDKILYCLRNREFLQNKYSINVDYVKENMTYEVRYESLLSLV